MVKNKSLKSKKNKRDTRHKHNRHRHTTKHKKSSKKHRKNYKHRRSNSRNRRVMKGGYGPGAGPVGYSWKSDPASWPGAYASQGGNTNGMQLSNFYKYNSTGTGVGGPDPAISTRGDLADLYYQNGGGIPQDIINLGRSTMDGAKTFMADLGGYADKPISSNVTIQPNINDNYKVISSETPKISQYVSDSSSEVANI
jgi:hypothetical protein